jgi:hypothetical protein
MADRVTQADIERICARLNEMVGDKFSLSGAYGGWSLRTKDGGSDVLYSGHVSKRELRDMMFAYMYGFMAAKEAVNV